MAGQVNVRLLLNMINSKPVNSLLTNYPGNIAGSLYPDRDKHEHPNKI
jgi:hypothetical protein